MSREERQSTSQLICFVDLVKWHWQELGICLEVDLIDVDGRLSGLRVLGFCKIRHSTGEKKRRKTESIFKWKVCIDLWLL